MNNCTQWMCVVFMLVNIASSITISCTPWGSRGGGMWLTFADSNNWGHQQLLLDLAW